MKTLFIFGTRPEAIKLAPLILMMRQSRSFMPVVCVTSQHREMLRQMLELFAIRPDFDFELMREDQDLLDFSSRALSCLRKLIDQVQPEQVIVQGDTTTAFLGAFAAAYRKIPVAHVEAGLRSFNHHNPFPEELNRVLVDQLSTWCFAPTEPSRQNLVQEGIAPEKIYVTGNTVVDALLMIQKKIGQPERAARWSGYFKEKYDLSKADILVTTHRRESFGKDLESICRALLMIAKEFPQLQIVLPVHPNPNVKKPVEQILSGCPQIRLVEPLDYEPFLYLLLHADLAMTDSGGVQEEAPSFGVPVLVLRKTTERPELIQSGLGELVGTDTDAIVSAAFRYLQNRKKYSKPNPFGDGKASGRILSILRKKHGLS